MQPVAVFVSASVPPSKTPLVETAVSKLRTDEICDYFASKGNPVSDVLRSTPEFLELFIRNVRVDYTCLETYPTSDSKLKAPLVVVGGGLDPGVSTEDLKKSMCMCLRTALQTRERQRMNMNVPTPPWWDKY